MSENRAFMISNKNYYQWHTVGLKKDSASFVMPKSKC